MPKNRRINKRAREKAKREERLNRKNEFGMTDETPYWAVEEIRKAAK